MVKWLDRMLKHIELLAESKKSFFGRFTDTPEQAKEKRDLATFQTELEKTKSEMIQLKKEVAIKPGVIKNVNDVLVRLAKVECPDKLVNVEILELHKGIQEHFKKAFEGPTQQQ